MIVRGRRAFGPTHLKASPVATLEATPCADVDTLCRPCCRKPATLPAPSPADEKMADAALAALVLGALPASTSAVLLA